MLKGLQKATNHRSIEMYKNEIINANIQWFLFMKHFNNDKPASELLNTCDIYETELVEFLRNIKHRSLNM